MAVNMLPGIKGEKHSTGRKIALSYLEEELNLQIYVQVEFWLLKFLQRNAEVQRDILIFFQVCAETKSFLLLIENLNYVCLTFKGDVVLLTCTKKWHTCFSLTLWAQTWAMLQWVPKVGWQCQLPQRCIWADLSCQWWPHISFCSPSPFIIRCPKSVIYSTLSPLCSDIFAANK